MNNILVKTLFPFAQQCIQKLKSTEIVTGSEFFPFTFITQRCECMNSVFIISNGALHLLQGKKTRTKNHTSVFIMILCSCNSHFLFLHK